MYYGDTLKVECPKGSGNYMNLANAAEVVQHRLINLFLEILVVNVLLIIGNNM